MTVFAQKGTASCWSLLAIFAMTLVGCKKEVPSGTSSVQKVDPPRLAELSRIEGRRDPGAITLPDLTERDLRVRRRAVRALSRIADRRHETELVRALSDEDEEVVSWAAFGLGRLCELGAGHELVERLAIRAATLPNTGRSTPSGAQRFVLDPFVSIGEALGRCGTEKGEHTLRAWLRLEPPVNTAAVLGLGRLAGRTRRLLTPSLTNLLERVEGSGRLALGLYPLSRLVTLDDAVAARLLAVAPQALERGGDERTFALRALAATSPAAVPMLEKLVLSNGESSDRTDAARALGRLGDEGQRGLGRALSRLAWTSEQLSLARVLSPEYAVLQTIVAQLWPLVPREAESGLAKLAQLSPPDGAPPSLLRRMAALRCGAIARLKNAHSESRAVRECDLGHAPRTAKQTELELLDREKLTHARARRFVELASDPDPRIALLALELLGRHPEFRGVPRLLVSALERQELGVVATAARLLFHNSSWTSGPQAFDGADLRKIHAALEAALARSRPADALEVEGDLLEAAAALGMLNLRPRLDKACKDAHPYRRHRAERALARLGEKQPRCTTPLELRDFPEEPPVKTLKLRVVTDIGPVSLELDPSLAPLAVARIAELIKSGFYDGVSIHRVVPGAIVQLGDRGGDGFGGAGRDPLPSELSPVPFQERFVGVAVYGPDTGSSQFFVSLGKSPQFSGEYALIGVAELGFERLAEGDVIERIEIVR